MNGLRLIDNFRNNSHFRNFRLILIVYGFHDQNLYRCISNNFYVTSILW
jgi:hypothetical protein